MSRAFLTLFGDRGTHVIGLKPQYVPRCFYHSIFSLFHISIGKSWFRIMCFLQPYPSDSTSTGTLLFRIMFVTTLCIYFPPSFPPLHHSYEFSFKLFDFHVSTTRRRNHFSLRSPHIPLTFGSMSWIESTSLKAHWIKPLLLPLMWQLECREPVTYNLTSTSLFKTS